MRAAVGASITASVKQQLSSVTKASKQSYYSLPVQRGTGVPLYNHQSLTFTQASRLMDKTIRCHRSTRGRARLSGWSGLWLRSTKAIPLPSLLHKRPDDIQTGSGREGLKNREEGKRRGHSEQQGAQQKGRKGREGAAVRQEVNKKTTAEWKEMNRENMQTYSGTHTNIRDK